MRYSRMPVDFYDDDDDQSSLLDAAPANTCVLNMPNAQMGKMFLHVKHVACAQLQQHPLAHTHR